MTIRITPVAPVGSYKAICHVAYANKAHAFEERDMPLYPAGTRERGSELRARRVACGLTLRAFARRLGVSAALVSRVELGEAFIEEGQDEWDAALAMEGE